MTMEVDGGLLPVRLQFTSNWHYQVSAHEVGRELQKAYQSAMARHLGRLREANGGEFPLDYPHGHFLSERQQLIMLLETSTWEQYSRLRDELFGAGRYRVHGQALQNDEPVTTIIGNRENIRSIRVWSQWWGCADPYAIESEILACADQIRSMQQKFHAQRDWSRYSDAQLAEFKNQHRQELIDARGISAW
ncbi:hypothetical protein [Nocardia heshunensis]